MAHSFSAEATRATTQNAVATSKPESVFRAGALRVQSRACSATKIIMAPAIRFGGGKPIARDTSGTTAPSSRASHEGLATPVISASEQVVSPGSVGSLPAELGGAHLIFVGGQSRQSGRTRSARHGSQTPSVGTAPPEQWQEPGSRERPASTDEAQLVEQSIPNRPVAGFDSRGPCGRGASGVRVSLFLATGLGVLLAVLSERPFVRRQLDKIPESTRFYCETMTNAACVVLALTIGSPIVAAFAALITGLRFEQRSSRRHFDALVAECERAQKLAAEAAQLNNRLLTAIAVRGGK